jgi:hypothetical protein
VKKPAQRGPFLPSIWLRSVDFQIGALFAVIRRPHGVILPNLPHEFALQKTRFLVVFAGLEDD